MPSLPCLASAAVDDIGPGAILKNVKNDNYRAILIDWVGYEPKAVAVTADVSTLTKELQKYGGASSKKAKKLITQGKHPYKIEVLEDLEEWIVLERGSLSELLID